MTRDDQVAYLRGHSRPMEPIPTGIEPRPAIWEGIRAVAFDVYGTLFVSGAGEMTDDPDKREAEAFAALKLPDVTLGDYQRVIREHHQRRREEGVDHPEVEIREVWRELSARRHQSEQLCLAFECGAHPVWPMPRAAESLDALHRRGLVLGIVSNAQFYTPLLFPALLGRELPDFGIPENRCVFSHRLREAKPSTRLFQAMADAFLHLGIAPEETLYVGNDMRNDIRPAAAVGMRTALFAGDARSLRLWDDDPAAADFVLTELPR
jgi:putative hydrolase of the HAD superfamily